MALARDLNPMPDWIRSELVSRGVLQAYEARPAYRRNDYLGWIARAKLTRPAARVSTGCSTSSSVAVSTCA